jgi:hypothetical protein
MFFAHIKRLQILMRPKQVLEANYKVIIKLYLVTKLRA